MFLQSVGEGKVKLDFVSKLLKLRNKSDSPAETGGLVDRSGIGERVLLEAFVNRVAGLIPTNAKVGRRLMIRKGAHLLLSGAFRDKYI